MALALRIRHVVSCHLSSQRCEFGWRHSNSMVLNGYYNDGPPLIDFDLRHTFVGEKH